MPDIGDLVEGEERFNMEPYQSYICVIKNSVFSKILPKKNFFLETKFP